MATDFTSEAWGDDKAVEAEVVDVPEFEIPPLDPKTPLIVIKDQFSDPLETTLGAFGAVDITKFKITGGPDGLIFTARRNFAAALRVTADNSIGGADDMCG